MQQDWIDGKVITTESRRRRRVCVHIVVVVDVCVCMRGMCVCMVRRLNMRGACVACV